MIQITKNNFSHDVELKKINFSSFNIGAVVSFVGYVRDLYESKDDKLISLDLEFYDGMTQKSLNSIELSARKIWNLEEVKIIHRIGNLKLYDQIVLVIVASKHRDDAFDACQYIMNNLKNFAPFWKKEHTLKKSIWVNQKKSDILKTM